MTFRRSNRDLGRTAAAWLATCLVVLGGSAACLVIIFAGADDPLPGLASMAAAGCGLGLFLWLLREKPRNEVREQHSLWLFRRQKKSRVPYQLHRRRPLSEANTGRNRPPTADEIRDLANGLHNWVPARGGRPQTRPPQPDPAE